MSFLGNKLDLLPFLWTSLLAVQPIPVLSLSDLQAASEGETKLISALKFHMEMGFPLL